MCGEIGSWYFNERVREICCLIAKWKRLFAICKLKFDLSSAVKYLEASYPHLLTFLNLCTFAFRFLDYPEQLFDLLLSLGIKPVAVFDGQNLEAKKITREKRERLGVKSTSSHRGLIQRDYTPVVLTHIFVFPLKVPQGKCDKGRRIVATRE